MTGRYVAAIDQGTTATRCLLVDRQGRLVALAQQRHTQRHPRPGWVEHDAAEIWAATQAVLGKAMADAGTRPDQVAALGITNQRETFVVWERDTGRPVAPAVVWRDTRTAGRLADLTGHLDEATITRRTGLPLSTYPSGPSLRWLLDGDPRMRARAEAGDLLFGTMDTWLAWNLTGAHVTDVTNASRTLLLDLDTRDWCPELLAAMDVPRAMLPEVRPTVGVVGEAGDPAPGVPVAALVGDQQAALLGQTAFDPHQAACTFGTGIFLMTNTGAEAVRSRSGLVTTVAWTDADGVPVHALEGSVATAGSLVEWLRTGLGLIRFPAEVETLATSVEDSGGCHVVPGAGGRPAGGAATLHGEAPAALVGLTSYVTAGHVARAVLEAVAWQAKELVDAMTADTGAPLEWLAVDGAMTSNNWLMQRVADVIDVPVRRPMTAHAVALGAAYAAGLATRYWPDREVLRRHWHRAAEWRGRMDAATREREYAAWRTAAG